MHRRFVMGGNFLSNFRVFFFDGLRSVFIVLAYDLSAFADISSLNLSSENLCNLLDTKNYVVLAEHLALCCMVSELGNGATFHQLTLL
jgi:hypothetical protein